MVRLGLQPNTIYEYRTIKNKHDILHVIIEIAVYTKREEFRNKTIRRHPTQTM